MDTTVNINCARCQQPINDGDLYLTARKRGEHENHDYYTTGEPTLFIHVDCETNVNPELLNRELLKFVKYLESHNLTICIKSNGVAYPLKGREDLVAAYMNVITSGVR
jgi:hypothetical protein